MKNKIAIQMDDIKTIDFDFDSSFIIGLEGQKRNYDLFYYCLLYTSPSPRD